MGGGGCTPQGERGKLAVRPERASCVPRVGSACPRCLIPQLRPLLRVTVELTSDPDLESQQGAGLWQGHTHCSEFPLLPAQRLRGRDNKVKMSLRSSQGRAEVVAAHRADTPGDRKAGAMRVALSGSRSLVLPRRAVEKQALGGHRKAIFPEWPVAADPLSNKWQISKESRKQVRRELASWQAAVAGPAASGGLCL